MSFNQLPSNARQQQSSAGDVPLLNSMLYPQRTNHNCCVVRASVDEASGDKQQQLRSNIYSINANVAALQRLLSARTTQQDNTVKIENIVQATQTLITRTSPLLVKLTPPADDQDKMRRIEHQKLKRDFQAVLKQFQSLQKQAANKTRSALEQAKVQQQNLEAMAANQQQSDGGDEEDQPLMQTGQQQQLQQIKQLDTQIEYTSQVIQEREESIVHLERSIVQVNEIFRDLGTLVTEQGSMVDNIESNIESSAARMGDAVHELTGAEQHQKSARNRMCILLSIAGVILLILIIVLVAKR